MTEDCRSEHEVRRRIALGKEAFNKKKRPDVWITQHATEEVHGESICVECT